MREREKWEEALKLYNRRVVVALLARGIRIDRAKDLAQEAWTRVIEQHVGGSLDRVEFPGLVIRQALFLAQDAERAEMRIDMMEVEPLEIPSCEASPESRMISRQLLFRAKSLISDLPSRTRLIFQVCCDGRHLSHAEAATQLGISLQHVRQTLYEVRKRLRALLENGR